jgi:hypothetical protein
VTPPAPPGAALSALSALAAVAAPAAATIRPAPAALPVPLRAMGLAA